MFRHLARAACVLVSVVAGAGVARAGDVTGRIGLPEQAPPPPELVYRGFLDRAENASLPVKPFDPTPYMVVVLEGGTAPAPTGVSWDLVGESFARPLLPVRNGAEVTVKNKGKRVVTLTADTDPALVPAGPINPTGSRAFTPKTSGMITLTDAEIPHLRGRLLVLDAAYFAMPDSKGNFTIKDVPPGEYKVKIWYVDDKGKGGWLDRPDDSVTQDKKGDATVNPKIPAYKIKAG
jgi:hypothetical protein